MLAGAATALAGMTGAEVLKAALFLLIIQV
jgi:hypothetical protein